jgi:hypothetical protein
VIKPTVGRIVWYHPTNKENLEVLLSDMTVNGQQNGPLAAMVLAVHSDTQVNLMVYSAYGQSRFVDRAYLWQGDGGRPVGVSYAEWMPYQIGQAKKETESK